MRALCGDKMQITNHYALHAYAIKISAIPPVCFGERIPVRMDCAVMKNFLSAYLHSYTLTLYIYTSAVPHGAALSILL
jgi:hypothetical protein